MWENEDVAIDWRTTKFDERCDWSAAPTWDDILEIKDVIRRREGGEK